MASLKFKEITCVLYSILLFVSGLVLIGVSIYLCYKIIYHFNFIPNSSLAPFIIYFFLGFVHLLLTWLGVRGPTREHDFHLYLFMSVTVLLFVGECAVGVWSLVLRSDVDVESVELMSNSFDLLLKSNYVYDKNSWSRLESKLKCCGLNGADEYKRLDIIAPLSCCNLDHPNATCPEVFLNGCKIPLIKYARKILLGGAVMGFVVMLVNALGLFVFVVYFRALKKERGERIHRRLEAQRANDASANSTPAV